MIVSENDGRLPIYFTKVRTNDLLYTLGGIWENLWLRNDVIIYLNNTLKNLTFGKICMTRMVFKSHIVLMAVVEFHSVVDEIQLIFEFKWASSKVILICCKTTWLRQSKIGHFQFSNSIFRPEISFFILKMIFCSDVLSKNVLCTCLSALS